jgi:tRNA pseudouridine13 synthase
VAEEALDLERAALAGCEGWQTGLEAAGVEGGRRALRVIPSNLEWEDLADGGLTVRFALPRGAYATAVIRELFGDRDRPGP